MGGPVCVCVCVSLVVVDWMWLKCVCVSVFRLCWFVSHVDIHAHKCTIRNHTTIISNADLIHSALFFGVWLWLLTVDCWFPRWFVVVVVMYRGFGCVYGCRCG